MTVLTELRESALGWLSEQKASREVGAGGLAGSRLQGPLAEVGVGPETVPPAGCLLAFCASRTFPWQSAHRLWATQALQGAAERGASPCSLAEKDLGPAFKVESEGSQLPHPADRHPESEEKPKAGLLQAKLEPWALALRQGDDCRRSCAGGRIPVCV